MMRAEFEAAGMVVEPTNYGRFDTLRFLVPFGGFRRKPVDKVWESVQDVELLYPDAKISFLAHSFGTFIVANILQRQFGFKAHRIAFCGSVVDPNFPFAQISQRFTAPLVNEVSSRDGWPVLGESVTWGYGSAGTYGFKVPRVRDRWHRGFGHSQYLTQDFCQRFWIPFFRDGKIVEGDVEAESPVFWVRLLSIIKIKYALLVCMIGLLGSFYLVDTNPNKYPDIDGPLGRRAGNYPAEVSKQIPSFDPNKAPPFGTVPNPTSTAPNPPLGPSPGPNCHKIYVSDNSVYPPNSYPVWDCKAP
jgi:hypothetical protein